VQSVDNIKSANLFYRAYLKLKEAMRQVRFWGESGIQKAPGFSGALSARVRLAMLKFWTII
jgi:hypothetical protein